MVCVCVCVCVKVGRRDRMERGKPLRLRSTNKVPIVSAVIRTSASDSAEDRPRRAPAIFATILRTRRGHLPLRRRHVLVAVGGGIVSLQTQILQPTITSTSNHRNRTVLATASQALSVVLSSPASGISLRNSSGPRGSRQWTLSRRTDSSFSLASWC